MRHAIALVVTAATLALAPSCSSDDKCTQRQCPTAVFCDKDMECKVDGVPFTCMAAECYGASLAAGTHTITLAFGERPAGSPPDFQITFSRPVDSIALTSGSYSCMRQSAASFTCTGVPDANATLTVSVPAGADVTMGMQLIDQSCVDANASCGG